MRFVTLLLVLLIAATSATAQPVDPVVLVVHGGAETIRRDRVTPETEASIRGALEEALRVGHQVIQNGNPALDGVVAAIQILEDSPHFNAGVGGVFAADGSVRHDAGRPAPAGGIRLTAERAGRRQALRGPVY